MTIHEELIEKAVIFYNDLGYIPSVRDYSFFKDYPSPKTVKKYFGSWKGYIDQCEFDTDARTKRETETVYIGRNDWMNDDYYTDLKNMNSHLQHIVQQYADPLKINYDMIHNQLIVMFEWNEHMYAVSFLNIYVEDYYDKIDTIKEVLKDMDIKLLNLNGRYRWWEKQLTEFFEKGEWKE